MSALKLAKIGVWSTLNALIAANDEGLITSQNAIPLPELTDASDVGVMQYLSLLLWVQWSNKFWTDTTRLLNYESLFYLKNEIYYWYQDPNYPIAQRLQTYSRFYNFLDTANTYMMTNRSQGCQDHVTKLLTQMRLNFNQWIWKTFVGDFDQQIATAILSLSQCQ